MDYTTLSDAELSARYADIAEQLGQLAEVEHPTAGQHERHDNLTAAAAAIEGEQSARARRREYLAERKQIALEAVRAGRIESGFAAPQVMSRQPDPHDGLDETTFRMADTPGLLGRARTAIERTHGVPDAGKELLTRLVDVESEHSARLAAMYGIAAGSDAYMRAFKRWLKDPVRGHLAWTPEEGAAYRAVEHFRAALTTGNTGALLPQQLDPTIVLTSDGSSNPFRAISRVEQGFTNQFEAAVSAGVTAEWHAEGSEFSDATPSITSKTIAAVSAGAYVFGSYEVLADTDVQAQIPRLMLDAKDTLEADAFAVGSGSGAPTGVVTAVAAVTASRVDPTTGGTFSSASVADVYSVIEAVPPRNRGRSSWVGEYSVLNTIRTMDSTGGGGEFWTNLSGGTPASLLGRPVYEASAMDSAITTGSNILISGDFSEYLIYDRIGMSLVYEPVVKGSNQRPTGQGGFLAFWRVGADVTNANAFRVLQL